MSPDYDRLFLFSVISFAQVNTEVYVFDIKKKGDKYLLSNQKNISNFIKTLLHQLSEGN